MTRTKLLLASLLLAVGSAQAASNTYKLDPNHTVVLASWDHGGYSRPSANFGGADGTLVFDPDKVEASSVDVTLPMSGLDAFAPKLTEHLRTADFFDAEKWPTARFKSTKVEQGASPNKLKVTGDLTIRDVTKPVVLDVTLNKTGEGRGGAPKVGFDATTTILRSEFGVAKFIPSSSDEVQIRITTEATVPQAPTEAAK
jgi:polyisoprenoid-binding protein YceI